MKKVKTLLMVSAMFIVGALSVVHGEKFDYSKHLVEGIEEEIYTLPRVVTLVGKNRPKEVLKICRERLEYLKSKLDDPKGDVKAVIGNYRGRAKLREAGCEMFHLSKTRTMDDLRHNLAVMIRVYEELQTKVSIESGEPSRAAEDESGARGRTSAHYYHRRDNRQRGPGHK